MDRNRPVAGSLITLGGVALRKESVDRNYDYLDLCVQYNVALRKESVDRNDSATPEGQRVMSRSPQGERG